jgi:D-arabinose 1-dehydrogenase-like Zn-dependent alcohol dehydrogenase
MNCPQVTAPTGGVGLRAIQVAQMLGATVIATTRAPAKSSPCSMRCAPYDSDRTGDSGDEAEGNQCSPVWARSSRDQSGLVSSVKHACLKAQALGQVVSVGEDLLAHDLTRCPMNSSNFAGLAKT